MKSLRKSLILVALVTASSTLFAQPSPPTGPDDPDVPKVEGEGEVGTTGELIINVDIPTIEMESKIGEVKSNADADHKSVVKLQLRARSVDKDIIKLNCINDKLLQIRALLNIIDGAAFEFEGAIATQNDDKRRDEYRKIVISGENVRRLKEAAHVCAGELDPDADSLTDFDGPDIPDDPGDDLFPDGIEDPGYASPYN